MPDSTPRARVVRLVALLARSPGTLDQLRHQDAVSRRQQREREAEVNCNATANEHEAGGVDEASAGEEGGAGKQAAVLLFIAGDRSQVHMWGCEYLYVLVRALKAGMEVIRWRLVEVTDRVAFFFFFFSFSSFSNFCRQALVRCLLPPHLPASSSCGCIFSLTLTTCRSCNITLGRVLELSMHD